MARYANYRIGNALRGPLCFKARTDKEAWTKGTGKITKILARMKLEPGERKPPVIVLWLEREVHEVHLTDKLRDRLAKDEQDVSYWVTVLGGYSNEPWPDAA